jgi:hypothetical protein
VVIMSGVQLIGSVSPMSTTNCSNVLPASSARTWKRIAANSFVSSKASVRVASNEKKSPRSSWW